jgi:hypothetical protein
MHRSLVAGVVILLSIGVPAAEAETPKRGGTLTYMIPALAVDEHILLVAGHDANFHAA